MMKQGWHIGLGKSLHTYWINDTPRAYIQPVSNANSLPYMGRVYYSSEPRRYYASLEEAKIMLEAMVHLEGDN